jgi:phosphoribosylglycinamide formyltransferase/phosphoribosylglycinamide formyltransferase-1
MRVAVAVSGRGSNLEALFAGLGSGDEARIILVLGDRAEAPAFERARDRGVTAVALTDWRNPDEWLALLAAHSVDLLVLAGFLKLVPPAVIAAYRGRIMNVHPALLPAFGGKGMYGIRVHEAVLASGAAESGCTVHLVEEEYDRGMILVQARVPILPGDTAQLLASRVLEQEHRLLPAVVLAAARAGHPVVVEPSPAAR